MGAKCASSARKPGAAGKKCALGREKRGRNKMGELSNQCERERKRAKKNLMQPGDRPHEVHCSGERKSPAPEQAGSANADLLIRDKPYSLA
jgi:hypothetical protein